MQGNTGTSGIMYRDGRRHAPPACTPKAGSECARAESGTGYLGLLACVVPKPEQGSSLTTADILDFLRSCVAKFWLPDAVMCLEAVPKTSVGKFDKTVLRERCKNWQPLA